MTTVALTYDAKIDKISNVKEIEKLQSVLQQVNIQRISNYDTILEF